MEKTWEEAIQEWLKLPEENREKIIVGWSEGDKTLNSFLFEVPAQYIELFGIKSFMNRLIIDPRLEVSTSQKAKKAKEIFGNRLLEDILWQEPEVFVQHFGYKAFLEYFGKVKKSREARWLPAKIVKMAEAAQKASKK